jgi:hypothetical protein
MRRLRRPKRARSAEQPPQPTNSWQRALTTSILSRWPTQLRSMPPNEDATGWKY